MLLRYRVANVRSLREEQELSFVVPEGEAGQGARELALSDGRNLEVYSVLGIFGANASGKSNLLRALRNMKAAVRNSYATWGTYEGIPRDAFSLDPAAEEETTFHEVDFVLEDGVRWTYGFELSDRRVEAEWLHAYPRGQREVWLDRDASREQVYDFPGDKLEDRAVLGRTPDRSLLLTRAGYDRHPQLAPVFDWFTKRMWSAGPDQERKDPKDREDREAYTARRVLEDEQFRDRLIELLRVADLGIVDVEVERIRGGRPLVRLVHSSGGQETVLDWEEESYGTRSWFALIGPLLLTLDTGGLLLLDELDASLHPRFAAEVVNLFQRPVLNTKGAQLVFTAHDPSLMRSVGGSRLLEAAQVWLTEKDKDGATDLTPASDWEPTAEEDLMSSYLTGVFGAVPQLGHGQIGLRLLGADAANHGEAEAS